MSTRISNEPTVIEQDKVGYDQILVDPTRNMRRFPPPAKEIQDLATDILDKGQLQPVVVQPVTDANGFKYSLVAGYQRMAAIGALIDGGHKMDVLVRVVDADDQGAILANISENAKRSSTSIIDLSYAIGRLKDGESTKDEVGTITVTQPAMSLKEIAMALGLSQGNVSEIDKMRNLRVPIQKKVHNGEITKDLARQMIHMTEEQQDKVLEQLAAGESASTLVQAVKSNKAGKGDKKRKTAKGKEEDGGKRPLSAKAALLVMEELTAKPVVEEGEEPLELTGQEETVVTIFKLFKKFLEGKLGAKALVNQIKAAV